MYGNPYYKPYWQTEDPEDSLEHYGVLGMKWGIRRYQNKDGTLTAAGKKRYAGDTPEQIERSERRKAKVVKAAKVTAAVAAVGAASAIGFSALSSSRAAAGIMAIGSKELGKLINSGMLSGKKADELLTSEIARNGTRHLDMRNWDNRGNPYYQPGPSKGQQELLTAVINYELDKKRNSR